MKLAKNSMDTIQEETLSEYDSSLEEAMDEFNKVFGTFSEFAAYNKNCVMFGFDIVTVPPTDKELAKFRKVQDDKRKSQLEDLINNHELPDLIATAKPSSSVAATKTPSSAAAAKKSSLA